MLCGTVNPPYGSSLELLPEYFRCYLEDNWRTVSARDNGFYGLENYSELHPVIKLYRGDGACTWILMGLDPDDSNSACGLVSLMPMTMKWGRFKLSEIAGFGCPPAYPILRDTNFEPLRYVARQYHGHSPDKGVTSICFGHNQL